jgi:hypothetical protein
MFPNGHQVEAYDSTGRALVPWPGAPLLVVKRRLAMEDTLKKVVFENLIFVIKAFGDM